MNRKYNHISENAIGSLAKISDELEELAYQVTEAFNSINVINDKSLLTVADVLLELQDDPWFSAKNVMREDAAFAMFTKGLFGTYKIVIISTMEDRNIEVVDLGLKVLGTCQIPNLMYYKGSNFVSKWFPLFVRATILQEDEVEEVSKAFIPYE